MLGQKKLEELVVQLEKYWSMGVEKFKKKMKNPKINKRKVIKTFKIQRIINYKIKINQMKKFYRININDIFNKNI